MGHARPIDVQIASERVQVAYAQLLRARSNWLPTVSIGVNYARQDGRIQDIVGQVFTTTRSSFAAGIGPTAVFSPTDALMAPKAAEQVLNASHATRQAVAQDVVLGVAEAYFAVQRARGELTGAEESARLAEDLADRTEKLASGLAQPHEATRARAELARRRQTVERARESWSSASAELARILRLPATALIEPSEPPHLRVDLFDPTTAVDELVPIALTTRPELAAQQAMVQATLARLKQEKLRPLVPSIVLRGNAGTPGGAPLSTGYFAGGVDGRIGNGGVRNAFDVQVLWELQGLGFGNAASIQERSAENRIAMLELFRAQDRVAAEVVRSHASLERANNRARLAEEGLKAAAQTVKTNLEGLSQTRRVGEMLVLVIRPQEALAAVQSLSLAYSDYFDSIAELNVAQYRLYRAMGHPTDGLLAPKPPVVPLPTSVPTISAPSSEPPPGNFATDR